MTNNIQESLQANLANILASVPEEFHDNVQAEIAKATPVSAVTDTRSAVITELKNNPNINEDLHIKAAESDSTLESAVASQVIEASEEEKKAILAETMQACGLSGLPEA